jgi:hypothetical protein
MSTAASVRFGMRGADGWIGPLLDPRNKSAGDEGETTPPTPSLPPVIAVPVTAIHGQRTCSDQARR